MLKSILSGRDNVQKIDKINDIPVNPLFDSELEQRFMEAVRTKVGAANVSDTIRNGKHSYYVKLDDNSWEIEPQVYLDESNGVSVPCKPDFVFWPVSAPDHKPVAVFTDGFLYHKDIVPDDTIKREAIHRSGNFRVWSLSFKDVQSVFAPQGDFYTETLEAEKMPSGKTMYQNMIKKHRVLAGEEHPNDIFIVGDSHQRIYRNHPTLSKCGINVRGRSSILKINYRTTEEIRKHAFALLNGISFDDLDEGLDIGDRCQSLTHGEKPIIENFSNANDEFDFILSEVKKLKNNGVALTDICVVARTKKLVDDYIALFTGAGIRSYAIKRNKVDDRSFDGLRVATMHRVKGLEFKYVFIAAVNNRIIPLPSAINKTDPVSEAESITSEKCLLYVAMTRAQKGVYITSYGKESDFLKP